MDGCVSPTLATGADRRMDDWMSPAPITGTLSGSSRRNTLQNTLVEYTPYSSRQEYFKFLTWMTGYFRLRPTATVIRIL
ncbi:hypothetical protein TIFTF001_056054 [Ficus carica]|uniref:Uncharacterized protein n=1 Tax=Ficus carica TaxID=3494 RepID=A0AA88EMD0_FICCA|nr:hypothetical protein TIFTF001_046210 [Ficus carica]GMN73061.1 hypothetical protein TIFTF001_056053 [Ficus carica]GMN73064.1 hypothetical protein TIFTF001_056054 [Ficus carica]